MLRRRPAMHIEGFNMHALEGAIHMSDQYHLWLLLQNVLIDQYLFAESSNMYRANNTLVHV